MGLDPSLMPKHTKARVGTCVRLIFCIKRDLHLRRILFPLFLGLSGLIVLCWLGFWQLDRLAWKQDILADINARLTAAPVALPATPDAARDAYLPVTLDGTVVGPELHVLVSGTAAGTGYLVIRAFETTDDRRILVDAGLLSLEDKATVPTAQTGTLTGNLIWPDDVNGATPEPDVEKNIWFGRDVVSMSDALQTEPLMVVARDLTSADPRLTVLPVDTIGIKNDHLSYAVTWFGLAFVWALMTLFLISRTLRTKDT